MLIINAFLLVYETIIFIIITLILYNFAWMIFDIFGRFWEIKQTEVSIFKPHPVHIINYQKVKVIIQLGL